MADFLLEKCMLFIVLWSDFFTCFKNNKTLTLNMKLNDVLRWRNVLNWIFSAASNARQPKLTKRGAEAHLKVMKSRCKCMLILSIDNKDGILYERQPKLTKEEQKIV